MRAYLCLFDSAGKWNTTSTPRPAPVFPVLFSGSLTQDITQCLQQCSLQAHILQQRTDCLAAGYSNVHLSVSPTFNPIVSGSWNLNLETHLSWLEHWWWLKWKCKVHAFNFSLHCIKAWQSLQTQLSSPSHFTCLRQVTQDIFELKSV